MFSTAESTGSISAKFIWFDISGIKTFADFVSLQEKESADVIIKQTVVIIFRKTKVINWG